MWRLWFGVTIRELSIRGQQLLLDSDGFPPAQSKED